MVGKTNNALQRHFSQKPNAPSITVGTGRPGNLSDRVGGGIIIRHAHVVIDSGTETGKTSATESSGLRTGFGSESAACDAASCHTIVEIVLGAELCGCFVSIDLCTLVMKIQRTPSIQHSVPAKMDPTRPKFFALLQLALPISLNPCRSWSFTGSFVMASVPAVMGAS